MKRKFGALILGTGIINHVMLVACWGYNLGLWDKEIIFNFVWIYTAMISYVISICFVTLFRKKAKGSWFMKLLLALHISYLVVWVMGITYIREIYYVISHIIS